MRTPKQKKAAPKGKGRGGGLKRKNAMKNKMMKKTMLAVGGDDTREDAIGLMNDSDLSVCVAKDNREPDLGQTDQDLVLRLSPEKPKKIAMMMTKSLSLVSMKTKETTEELTNGIMKRTRSLRSAKNKRKLSNEENIDFTLATSENATSEKKTKVDVKEPLGEEQDPNVLSLPEQTLAKISGVKSMITNAVWGVPYAKVVEDIDISVCEPELEDPVAPKSEGKCIIS